MPKLLLNWVLVITAAFVVLARSVGAQELPTNAVAVDQPKPIDHAPLPKPVMNFEHWEFARDGIPDLWAIERIECRGNCPKFFLDLLKQAQKAPQSFSDPKRRVQYDFVECPGQMGLWMHKVTRQQALDESNRMVYPKFRTNAKGWGLRNPEAYTGFVVCFNPDGSFTKLFTLVNYQGDRMIGYVMDGFVVHYKAVPAKTR